MMRPILLIALSASGVHGAANIFEPIIRHEVYGTIETAESIDPRILAKEAEEKQDYLKAISLWEQIIEAERIKPREIRNDLNIAEALRNLAEDHYLNGAFNAADKTFEESAVIFRNRGTDEQDELHLALALNGIGRCKRQLGKKVDSYRSLSEAGQIFKRYLGDRHILYLSNRVNIADILAETGKPGEAEKIYKESLRSFSEDTDNRLPMASASNHLGNLLKQQGRYKEAIAYYLESLNLYEGSVGTKHSYTASAQGALGTAYLDINRPDLAEPLLVQSYETIRRLFGDSREETGTALCGLGSFYFQTGAFTQSEQAYIGCLEIYMKNSVSLAYIGMARGGLGIAYMGQSRYQEAELLITQGIADISARGEDNAQAIRLRRSLAEIYLAQGKTRSAREIYKNLLAQVGDGAIPSEEAADLIDGLGETLMSDGEYKQAETMYMKAIQTRQALDVAGEQFSPVHYVKLATLYAHQGLYQKAADLLEQALSRPEGNSTRLRENDKGLLLHMLGNIRLGQNDIPAAMQHLEQSLALHKVFFGNKHIATAAIMNDLANAYSSHDEPEKAEELYKRALEISTNTLGAISEQSLAIQGGLATSLARQGKSRLALAIYTQLLSHYRDRLAWYHPSILKTLHGMIIAEGNNKQGVPSASLYREVARIEAHLIQKEGPYLTRAERPAFVESLSSDSSYFEIAFKSTDGAKNALFSRLNRQGLLEEIEKRQAQLASLPGNQRQVAEELYAVGKELASANTTAAQRKLLTSRQEELERQLYRLLPEIKPRIVELEQVAASLPASSALIEFQRFQPYDADKPRGQNWGAPRYLALILKADATVTALDLGPAAVIETKIQKALHASEQQLDDAETLWESVGNLLLDPLFSSTRGVRTLFISPDGELNRLPFAALPAPGSQQLLGETIKLRLLTTGRELLDLEQPPPPAQSSPLVVADPDFDQPVSSTAVATATAMSSVEPSSHQHRSADLGTPHWASLPATAKEGQVVSSLTNARLLTKQQATATSVQQQRGPRILHIASHAFYLADQSDYVHHDSPPFGSVLEGPSGLSIPAFNGENPLLRSGIALAGANRAPKNPAADADDGYLTALEVSQLDWKGTEMVVISACESGRGDIRAGEGVYGLKRAIAVAGARSSLLSLWKVDDAATAAFMQSFYERLKAGTPRADALAETQKQFRQHPIPAWRHPYVWAAFQLSGDWSSIHW